MWNDERIRESCMEGDRLFREALVEAGAMPSPVPPAPEPHVSFSMVMPFPSWPSTEAGPKTLKRIAQEVAHKRGLTMEELTGSCKKKKYVEARQECFWRARRETRQSLPQIGAFFHKDHTTVLHGIRRWEARHA